MTHSTTRLSGRMMAACLIACLSILLTSSGAFAQTRPNLGTASTYAIFTGGGAINNTGLSVLVGDVGQDGAYSFNGFPPGTYTGTLNRNNGASALAKADLITAQTVDGSVACGTVLGVGIVDGQSFDPGVYCSGAATTTTGHITFNAHGNASAIFIVKIGGELSANSGTHILLANNARAANIYWFVDGAVTVHDSSSFVGTIIANGAITFLGQSSLNGRALVAPAGAINISANNMSVSTDTGSAANNLTVVKPASGDTILRGALNDTISWRGTGIARVKTLQYSLDSGATWTTIATITNDSLAYSWHVPDTTSTKAMVRITDTNNMRGVSGIFTISSSKKPGSMVVVHPKTGEVITGGMQNYQINWSGTGLASQKTFALSLDGGSTWAMIGSSSTDGFTYSWNVPDTASALAMISITDSNGIMGQSGIFTISHKTIVGSIIVVHPAAGEVIAGGMQNYQIVFSTVNATQQKFLEYSLDGGANWSFIGSMKSDALSYTWANVPNVATTQALVRITDANGVTGTSGLFSITMTQGVGSINSILLSGLNNNNNIGNNQTLGISWTFTPDIGTSVTVEYSLDNSTTWNTIGTVPVTTSPNSTTWQTSSIGYHNPVYIRVISTEGMTATSFPFSIGSNASVFSEASQNGYSVSNYPNPAREQTTISFVLPVESDVTLTITDELGRDVGTIVKQRFNSGTYAVPFNTSMLMPGVYDYMLQAGTTRIAGRMNVIK
jgi:hypothetical protein